MADGQALNGRFPCQMSIIIQHLVRREVARIMRAVGEVTIGDGGDAGQKAALPELVQHAVDTVGIFTSILQDQDAACPVKGIRRADKGREDRQIAANNRPFCLSRNDGRQLPPGRQGQGTLPCVCRKALKELACRIGIGAAEGDHERPIGRDQAAFFPEGNLQRRHITEADDQFRMSGDIVVIQLIEDACRAIAAIETEDGLDVIVVEQGVDIAGPFLIGPGKEAVTPGNRRHQLDAISSPFQPGYSCRNILSFIVRRRRGNADTVAAMQCRSPEGSHGLHSPL